MARVNVRSDKPTEFASLPEARHLLYVSKGRAFEQEVDGEKEWRFQLTLAPAAETIEALGPAPEGTAWGRIWTPAYGIPMRFYRPESRNREEFWYVPWKRWLRPLFGREAAKFLENMIKGGEDFDIAWAQEMHVYGEITHVDGPDGRLFVNLDREAPFVEATQYGQANFQALMKNLGITAGPGVQGDQTAIIQKWRDEALPYIINITKSLAPAMGGGKAVAAWLAAEHSIPNKDILLQATPEKLQAVIDGLVKAAAQAGVLITAFQPTVPLPGSQPVKKDDEFDIPGFD